MIIYVCDKCKGQSDKQGNGRCNPKGWRALTFGTGYGRPNLDYILCPKCQEELKLPENKEMMDFGEQLLEIISQIAQEAVNAERAKAEQEAQDERDKIARVEADNKRAAEAEEADRRRRAEVERKRCADSKHREQVEGGIHYLINQIVDDFDTASKIVTAIKNGKIPNVIINY